MIFKYKDRRNIFGNRIPLIKESRTIASLLEGKKLLNEESCQHFLNANSNSQYLNNISLDRLTQLERQFDPMHNRNAVIDGEGHTSNDEVGSKDYLMWILKNRRALENAPTINRAWGGGSQNSAAFYLQVYEATKPLIKQIAKCSDTASEQEIAAGGGPDGKYGKNRRPELWDRGQKWSANINDYTGDEFVHTMKIVCDELLGNKADKEYKALKRYYNRDDLAQHRRDYDDFVSKKRAEAEAQGTEFTPPEYREPHNVLSNEGDFRVAFEDDKWMVIEPNNLKAEAFFGQKSRTDEVNSIWGDQIRSGLPYRNAGAIYQSAEWCTVPSEDRFRGYGGGRWRHLLFINIPKVTDEGGHSKPDWMSPYKVQCDIHSGHSNWANVLDNNQPVRGLKSIFRLPMSKKLVDWYISKGFIHNYAELYDNNGGNVTRYDVHNGRIQSTNARAVTSSVCPELNQSAGGTAAGRYFKVESNGLIFLGYDSEEAARNVVFRVLDRINGDPSENYYVGINLPTTRCSQSQQKGYFEIFRQDGKRMIASVDGQGTFKEEFEYNDKQPAGDSILYFSRDENGSPITYMLNVQTGDLSSSDGLCYMFGPNALITYDQDEDVFKIGDLRTRRVIKKMKNPTIVDLMWTNLNGEALYQKYLFGTTQGLSRRQFAGTRNKGYIRGFEDAPLVDNENGQQITPDYIISRWMDYRRRGMAANIAIHVLRNEFLATSEQEGEVI